MKFISNKVLINKKANLDEHIDNIAKHGAGSQIMVPKVLNDGTPVSNEYHNGVKNKIESAGLVHKPTPATGGWVSESAISGFMNTPYNEVYLQ